MTNSKPQALFEQIRGDILSLRLAPDAPLRLPILSKQYGVGLTPLRECLNRLCSDLLVVPEHNKGFRVASLTHAELLDLERSRNAIEGAMFTYSVRLGDDAWEAGLIGAYHHLSQTPVPHILQDQAGLDIWTRRHAAFHAALVARAHSLWMRRFAAQLEDQLGRYHLFIQNGLRDLMHTAPDIAEQANETFAAAMALAPHTALYDAALARDLSAASTAFDAHSALTLNAFIRLTQMAPEESSLSTTLRAAE